jgi:hypothetical protein
MEEFLPLLSTDLMVFTFKKCIKRMHGDVVCLCACVRAAMFRHRTPPPPVFKTHEVQHDINKIRHWSLSCNG